jgi:integrase
MPKRERGTGGLFKMKGSPNWYAQIYISTGKVRRITTGTDNKQEAQGILRRLLTDKDEGKPFVGDLNKVFYGELRAGLIQNYIERGNKSLLEQADGSHTINGLNSLDEFFGYEPPDKPGLPVSRMTTDAARTFANQRLEEGVTNSTINGSLACLRRMLRIAHEDGKIMFVPKIRLLKENAARKGFVSPETFAKLLKHLAPDLRPLVSFLYWCGLRRGEALQIEWSQVDLNAAVIRLEDEQTKSGEARTVPLPDPVLFELRKVKTKQGKVFTATNLRKEWPSACAAAGLGTLEPVDENGNRRYHGLILHDLRRSAVRNLRKAGVPESVAMKISGHKTRTVFDRYNIVDEADVVEAMRKLQDSGSHKSLLSSSESSVRVVSARPPRKRLTA